MTPERAREIAEGYDNDTKGMTDAILAACAEERRAALTEAANICHSNVELVSHDEIIDLRDKE